MYTWGTDGGPALHCEKSLVNHTSIHPATQNGLRLAGWCPGYIGSTRSLECLHGIDLVGTYVDQKSDRHPCADETLAPARVACRVGPVRLVLAQMFCCADLDITRYTRHYAPRIARGSIRSENGNGPD